MNWVYICKAQIQPKFLYAASTSNPGMVHTTVAKTLFNDSFCTCKGFEFRGYCKHTAESDEHYCRWFVPDVGQKQPKECPKCGGEVIRYTFDLEFDG